MEEMMFKVGDRVRCINASGTKYLIKGNEYEVAQIVGGWFSVLDPKTKEILNQGNVYNPYRFDKVGEPMNNGVIELNGKKYRVEMIEGKGECLVPVQPTPKAGQVWSYRAKPENLWLVLEGAKDAVRISFSGHNRMGFEPDWSKYDLVADTLSEAIQKGLVK